MKVMNEKKGFTLIELLAVIVVLAIVMVLATTTVLPFIAKSRRNAFAIEANAAIDAASAAVSLIQVDTIAGTANGSGITKGTDYTRKLNKSGETLTSTQYCFTLQQLIKIGSLKSEKIAKQGDAQTPYAGRVVVTITEGSNQFTYNISMKNANYEIVDHTGSVDGEEVQELGTNSSANYACPSDFNN